jgi:hypothetical protein
MTRFARTACLAAAVLALGIGAEPALAARAPDGVMLRRLAAVENEAEAIAEAEATGPRARAAAARTVAESVAARSTARTLAASTRSGARIDAVEMLFGN